MDLGYTAEQAANAMINFHKAMYRFFNSEYLKLQTVSDPKDLEENEQLFFNTPEEYNAEFINLVTVGCTMQQAFDILKETYKF